MANHFDHKTAAERYALGRPYYHPLVVCKIKTFLNFDHVQNVLDVACGTGQSTVAWKEISRNIVGTDISKEMINLAPHDDSIRYIVSPAEDIPLEDESFDMVTVSSAFHWLDRSRFLSEARRLLRDRGNLVIYNNSFSGKMVENAEFETWIFDVYLKKVPSPPKDTQPFGKEDAGKEGFNLLGKERYTNEVTWRRDDLVNYMLTQTNVIAAVEGGDDSLQDVESWLRHEIAPFFEAAKATFIFRGPIWYLEKMGA